MFLDNSGEFPALTDNLRKACEGIIAQRPEYFSALGTFPKNKPSVNDGSTMKQINRLCLTRVALNSLATDTDVALGFRIELEFRNVAF